MTKLSAGLLEQRVSPVLGDKAGCQLCVGPASGADGGMALLSFPTNTLELRQAAGLGRQQLARHPQAGLYPGQGVPSPTEVSRLSPSVYLQIGSNFSPRGVLNISKFALKCW